MTYSVSKHTRGYGRNAGHRWRSDDLARLRRLVRKGMALKEMSLKLGRPETAIRTKAHSIGLRLEDHLSERPTMPISSARSEQPQPKEPAISAIKTSEPVRQLELF